MKRLRSLFMHYITKGIRQQLCRMLSITTILGLLAVLGFQFLGIKHLSLGTTNPVSAASPISCGAGTFYFGGGCVPCTANPSQCPSPFSNNPPPSVLSGTKRATQTKGEHRVSVNTISRNEAPSFGLGVRDPSKEHHPACTVNGAPAYTLSIKSAAAGRCTAKATKYYKANAECPPGTHARKKGNSGQYWCQTDRTDYSIKNRVVGHLVCIRGTLVVTSRNTCLSCADFNSRQQPLLRTLSIQRGRCSYRPAPVTTTTKAPTPATTTTFRTPYTRTTRPPYIPPTTKPLTTRPPYIPPTTQPPVPTTQPKRPTLPVNPTPRPTPPEIPNQVSIRWSPRTAITNLPLFVWLEGSTQPTQQEWRDSNGVIQVTTTAVDSSVWEFEVVDGRGRKNKDSVICDGPGDEWKPTWIGYNGNPTPAARAEGGCWYVYQHMGDGSLRQVNVKVNWRQETCPKQQPATCSQKITTSSLGASIGVTEVQALLTTENSGKN